MSNERTELSPTRRNSRGGSLPGSLEGGVNRFLPNLHPSARRPRILQVYSSSTSLAQRFSSGLGHSLVGARPQFWNRACSQIVPVVMRFINHLVCLVATQRHFVVTKSIQRLAIWSLVPPGCKKVSQEPLCLVGWGSNRNHSRIPEIVPGISASTSATSLMFAACTYN